MRSREGYLLAESDNPVLISWNDNEHGNGINDCNYDYLILLLLLYFVILILTRHRYMK